MTAAPHGRAVPRNPGVDEGAAIDRSFEAVRDWLAGQIAEHLGVAVEDIDFSEPFASFGLSSQDLVVLSGDLEDRLGRSLSPTLAWEYPTIERLARHLAGADDPETIAGRT
ncbi:MAG: acyl carrier protein [Kiloniellaceae bacterium]